MIFEAACRLIPHKWLQVHFSLQKATVEAKGFRQISAHSSHKLITVYYYDFPSHGTAVNCHGIFVVQRRVEQV